jgi:hypothetical protein
MSLKGCFPKQIKLAPLGAPPSKRVDKIKAGSEHEVSLLLTDRDPFHVPHHLATCQVEHGLIATPTRLEFHLSFEPFPIRLLRLESELFSSMTISSFLLPSELQVVRADSNLDLVEGTLETILAIWLYHFRSMTSLHQQHWFW